MKINFIRFIYKKILNIKLHWILIIIIKIKLVIKLNKFEIVKLKFTKN